MELKFCLVQQISDVSKGLRQHKAMELEPTCHVGGRVGRPVMGQKEQGSARESG